MPRTDAFPITIGQGDRRRSPRHQVVRPCKLFRHATGRYTAACTRNVSDSGVLIDIESPRPLTVGERLGVGIAWTRSAVLCDAAMLTGEVVRVEDDGEDRQIVAVRFAAPAALAAAA